MNVASNVEPNMLLNFIIQDISEQPEFYCVCVCVWVAQNDKRSWVAINLTESQNFAAFAIFGVLQNKVHWVNFKERQPRCVC